MPKVILLSHTPQPERLIAAAAKLCYSTQSAEGLFDDLTPDKIESFVRMLVGLGHASPVEHVSFTFAIEGVSRSLLAQITRHRIASYSVQSQRYVTLTPPEYITPPEIADCPEAIALYQEAIAKSAEYYARLTEVLSQKHYDIMIAEGKDEKTAKQASQKKAIEDARFVLPNACETKMVVTMNVRSLYNFFNHRCCSRAQWEIKDLADMMLLEVKKVSPLLFETSGPPCATGKCPEGNKTCGMAVAMRAQYNGGNA